MSRPLLQLLSPFPCCCCIAIFRFIYCPILIPTLDWLSVNVSTPRDAAAIDRSHTMPIDLMQCTHNVSSDDWQLATVFSIRFLFYCLSREQFVGLICEPGFSFTEFITVLKDIEFNPLVRLPECIYSAGSPHMLSARTIVTLNHVSTYSFCSFFCRHSDWLMRFASVLFCFLFLNLQRHRNVELALPLF